MAVGRHATSMPGGECLRSPQPHVPEGTSLWAVTLPPCQGASASEVPNHTCRRVHGCGPPRYLHARGAVVRVPGLGLVWKRVLRVHVQPTPLLGQAVQVATLLHAHEESRV